MGLGQLKDRWIKALALRALRGKVTRWREGGNAVLKALDGNRTWISGVLYFAALLVAALTGHDLTKIVDGLMSALGWNTPGLREAAIIAFFAHQALALWGIVAGTIKRFKQIRAGASLVEVGSAEGYIKAEVAAIAEEIRKLRARADIVDAGNAAKRPTGASGPGKVQ